MRPFSVSHRCSGEHVHRQSPLPEGACALSVTAAQRGMCIPSVSHRCSRGHVHRQSPLLEGACAAALCQSPLLEGACASLVAAVWSGTCISSSVTAAQGSACTVTAASSPLEGTRAVTAARGSTCGHRCSRSARVNRCLDGVCELVRARGCGSHGGAHAPPITACERLCVARDSCATLAGVGIGGHRCSMSMCTSAVAARAEGARAEGARVSPGRSVLVEVLSIVCALDGVRTHLGVCPPRAPAPRLVTLGRSSLISLSKVPFDFSGGDFWTLERGPSAAGSRTRRRSLATYTDRTTLLFYSTRLSTPLARREHTTRPPPRCGARCRPPCGPSRDERRRPPPLPGYTGVGPGACEEAERWMERSRWGDYVGGSRIRGLLWGSGSLRPSLSQDDECESEE